MFILEWEMVDPDANVSNASKMLLAKHSAG